MKIILFNRKLNSIFNGNIFTGSIILFILFLTGGYIYQVSMMTKETSISHLYARKIDNIIDIGISTEYRFMQSNSLLLASELIRSFDFKEIDQVHHIKIIEPQVALR